MKTLMLKGEPNPRQIEFFKAKTRHIAYGGARGGGKSWAMRRKFVLLCLRYPGIKIILLRRTLGELKENHVVPLMRELNTIAKYNSEDKVFIFTNGSRLKLGYCDHENDLLQYQGHEYDVIGLEEATHFTEEMRRFFTTCNRSTRKDFKPRMYYTTNPGGIGHGWVKRLFIDREYQGKEKAEDYTFIPAKVYDNKALMEANPEYVEELENLPEDMREAHLHGNWDIFAGMFFREFRRDIHVIEPFEIPDHWRKFRAMDEGYNDPFVCLWIAIDDKGSAYVYRELVESHLLSADQVKKVVERTREKIDYSVGDTSFWNKSKLDSGQSPAEVFNNHGVPMMQANKERVNGWKRLREWLRIYEDTNPVTGEKFQNAKLKFFSNCIKTIKALPNMVYDDSKPEDMAAHPEDHCPDALRYWCMSRPAPAVIKDIRFPTREEMIINHLNSLDKRKKRRDSFVG